MIWGSGGTIADKNPANWMIVAINYYNSETSFSKSVGGGQKYGHPKNTKIEENKLNLRIIYCARKDSKWFIAQNWKSVDQW